MKASIIGRWLLTALSLLAVSAVCRGDEDSGGGWTGAPFTPEEPWKEIAVQLPAWPDASKLLQVRLDRAAFPFTVYLDPDSLDVGSDHVVRYTLVVVSSSGARNVSFEGLRCGTREYRRYAYGSGGKWQQAPGTVWRKVMDAGMDGYRNVLYRDYLCDPLGYDLQVSEILEKVRYARGVHIEE